MENPKKSRNFSKFLPTGRVDNFLQIFILWGKVRLVHTAISTYPQNPVDIIEKAGGSCLGRQKLVFSCRNFSKMGRGEGFLAIPLVDVRADIFNDLVGLRVALTPLLHPVDGMEDGGVVPVVKLLADLL